MESRSMGSSDERPIFDIQSVYCSSSLSQDVWFGSIDHEHSKGSMASLLCGGATTSYSSLALL